MGPHPIFPNNSQGSQITVIYRIFEEETKIFNLCNSVMKSGAVLVIGSHSKISLQALSLPYIGLATLTIWNFPLYILCLCKHHCGQFGWKWFQHEICIWCQSLDQIYFLKNRRRKRIHYHSHHPLFAQANIGHCVPPDIFYRSISLLLSSVEAIPCHK